MDDGETGLLTPAGDVDAMAEAAFELLDKERWGKVRAAAIERAAAFDESLIVPKYEALYERVVGR